VFNGVLDGGVYERRVIGRYWGLTQSWGMLNRSLAPADTDPTQDSPVSKTPSGIEAFPTMVHDTKWH